MSKVERKTCFTHSRTGTDKNKITLIKTREHLNLKHIEETKATSTSDGNKEYWYCEECNRYYSDKDGLNEISKEDTIIERLKDDNTNKDDNVVEIEHKDSNPIIWVVVPVVGVGVISGIILVIKRKR